MSDRIEAILCELEDICRATPSLMPEVRRRWDKRLEGVIETRSILRDDTSPQTKVLPRDPYATVLHSSSSTNRIATALGRNTSRNRFERGDKHRAGGLGVVYFAKDLEFDRTVALKEIKPERSHEPEKRARFVREAAITGCLEHPGIVPIYSLSTNDDGSPFYAMRFIGGRTLSDAIKDLHENNFRNSAERTLEFRKLLTRFVSVCQAIAFAHTKNILHRDLKPDNIMLGEFGETLVVDWGLAKRLQDHDITSHSSSEANLSSYDSLSSDGDIMGTLSYMAPEQAAGEINTLTPGCDIYSLGATLYCLLTNKAPFTGECSFEMVKRVQMGRFSTPRSINPRVSKPLDSICIKAMANAPGNRYRTANALAEDLEKYLADEPIAAYKETIFERMRRLMRKHPAIATSIAAAMVVGIIAALIVAYLQSAYSKQLQGKNQTISGQLLELTERNETIETQKSELQASNFKLTVAKQKAEDRENDAVNAVKRFGDIVAKNPELKNSAKLEVDPKCETGLYLN